MIRYLTRGNSRVIIGLKDYHREQKNMVATVTVATVATIAAVGLAASISLFSVILLIGFLTSKELLAASGGVRQKSLGRLLSISIVPLLISFAVIIGLKIAEILA